MREYKLYAASTTLTELGRLHSRFSVNDVFTPHNVGHIERSRAWKSSLTSSRTLIPSIIQKFYVSKVL